MDANEMQHWLDRNRPPRVQITYDVETLGSPVKQSIPFIVGVIGDFAGGDRTASSPIAKRAFVAIDRDNFTQVMKTLEPNLDLGTRPAFAVSRTPDGNSYEIDPGAEPFAVSLTFTRMEDFAPPAIIEQVPLLQAQMQKRMDLRDLLAKLGTAPDLDGKLKAGAAAPALDGARKALTDANAALTGAATAFTAAATAVLAAETDDARKQPVTDIQVSVTAAVGGPDGGFGKAFAAAGADSTAAQVCAAGNAAWQAAAALRKGMEVLSRTSSGYSPDVDKQKDAIPLVQAAATAVDPFVKLAGTAAVQGTSALALNANTAPAAPAPDPTPPPPPAEKS